MATASPAVIKAKLGSALTDIKLPWYAEGYAAALSQRALIACQKLGQIEGISFRWNIPPRSIGSEGVMGLEAYALSGGHEILLPAASCYFKAMVDEGSGMEERRNLRACQGVARTPALLFSSRGGMVLEYMPGATLSSDCRYELLAGVTKAIINFNLADIRTLPEFDYVEEFHRISVQMPDRVMPCAQEETKAYFGFIESLWDILIGGRLNYLKGKYPGNSHGDLNPANIIIDGEKVAFVDLVRVAKRGLFYDLARLYGSDRAARPYLKLTNNQRSGIIDDIVFQCESRLPDLSSQEFREAMRLSQVAAGVFDAATYHICHISPEQRIATPNMMYDICRSYAHLDSAAGVLASGNRNSSGAISQAWRYLLEGLDTMVYLLDTHPYERPLREGMARVNAPSWPPDNADELVTCLRAGSYSQ